MTAPSTANGVVPFRWPVGLTTLIVTAILLIDTLTATLPPQYQLIWHLTTIPLLTIALYETWTTYTTITN